MSRMNPQEYQVLQDKKFNEFCSVLGIKEQCCFAPDKKVIERAFRKSALKCHPDKGGDPVVFKKLNDAYNKLIGHIAKLEQQVEAVELAQSILIEVSKTSVQKWHEKLKTRYGWFKTDNCKSIIFDGPYKQYMGRSKNTGNITVVLYEDPPDQIPKIHVRSNKYMAWIAEQMMPVHMHVDKGKTIQFDQWRIAHLAEFGICNFASATPATPAPTPAKREPKPKTPKAKRREAREESERRAKTSRDSEPTPEPGDENKETENNKENAEPKKSDPFSEKSAKNMDFDEEPPVIDEKPFNCGHCGEGFNNLMDYALHKKICVPDEDFGFISGMKDVINNQYKNEKKVDFDIKTEKGKPTEEIKTETKENTPRFQCEKCDQKFTNMVWYAKHKNSCQIEECEPTAATSRDESVPASNNTEDPVPMSSNHPTQANNCEEPQTQNSMHKHSKISSVTKGKIVEIDNDSKQKTSKESFLPTTKENETNGKIVENDNDSNKKTSKESVLPTTKESDKIKTQLPMQSPINSNIEETAQKENKLGTKTGKISSVTNGKIFESVNDSNQKTPKESVIPMTKESEKIKTEPPVQSPIDGNVEETAHKKNSLGTKTGKVSKPTASKPTAKLKKTLSKDLEELDVKKKTDIKPTVEYMDVDQPEIVINKETVSNTSEKKNDMPMGSLLHNLPMTAKQTPTADMEMENSVVKSKQQVDKQNSSQKLIENEVPDTKSKPVVKFNLVLHSNSDKDLAKTNNILDLDALELTNKIFSTTNNDTNDVREVIPKTRDIPKALHKAPPQTKILGDLDKEAIKLTKVIFSNTNETTDAEDSEVFTNTSKKPVSKNKAPLKSIMKNTTMKTQTNIDGDKINKDQEKKSEITMKPKSVSNENINGKEIHSNGKELHANGTRESLTKSTADMKTKKDDDSALKISNLIHQKLENPKSVSDENINGKEIHSNGTRESLTKSTPDMKTKKCDDSSLKISNLGNQKLAANLSKHNNEKQNQNISQMNGCKEPITEAKPDIATSKSEEAPLRNGKMKAHTNLNTSKSTADNIGSQYSKNEVTQAADTKQQNKTVDSIVKPVLDTNNSKKSVENKASCSVSSTNNHSEHLCADQIYKQKESALKLSESNKGKMIKEDKTPSSQVTSNTDIEIKHAQQCFLLNQPLSPAQNRKDIGKQTSNVTQTAGPGLGSLSEIAVDKNGGKTPGMPRTKMSDTVNSEPKKLVVFSQIPNDTKTKGGKTPFLEQSGPGDTRQKVEHNLPVSDNIFRQSKSQAPQKEDSLAPKSLSLIPQALQRSYTSPSMDKKNTIKSDVDKNLETLDNRHAVKMQRIAENTEEASKDRKLDLSNNEVHTKRPAVLGPSRFDNPSGLPTGYVKENVPKRNDTAYNFKSENPTPSYQPTQSYQISKSSTTVLDTRKKSQEEYRKKIDRNFNVSPEPFYSDKTSSTVHFSDQPSSPYSQRDPLTPSSTNSSAITSSHNSSPSLKTTLSTTTNYTRPSDSTSIKSPAPAQAISKSKSYSTSTIKSDVDKHLEKLDNRHTVKMQRMAENTEEGSKSKSYSTSTIPSIASLPSPKSYSTSTVPSISSLPSPKSYSGSYSSPSTNTSASSHSSPATYTKQVATSPPTFSSPSNFTPSAPSSYFDNRARSEGSTLLTNSAGTTQSSYSVSNNSSKMSTDLYLQIQATKDKHKSDIDRAMNFNKTNWKPPVIKEKLPRPDPTPVKYTMTLGRDKTARMHDRDRTVMDRMMTDRASRGKSDDFLKSSSYRL